MVEQNAQAVTTADRTTSDETTSHVLPRVENAGDRTASAVVARVEDLETDTMKMVSVGETKVALITTSSGVYALDNACPHQGYGLTTGALSGDMVTCQWHNWKFDVRTGSCVIGEEDVAAHEVRVVDGDVVVEVTQPTDEEKRRSLWPSLRRGMEDDYVGQIARDTVRLLEVGVGADEILADALALTAPKADYGVGHEMAMAADCLALAEVRSGEDKALPLIQGLSGLSEETRDRPVTELPAGDQAIDFVEAIEAEDVVGAMASVVGQLDAGVSVESLRHQFLSAVSAHHLAYGHGIIYTQKSFEILDRLGWERARDLLPYLAERIVYSTREDTLPYMRPAMRSIDAVDLDALAAAPQRRGDWHVDPAVVASMLAADQAPIDTAVDLILAGGGVEGLLDVVSTAVSCRLLHHDLAVEFDQQDPFGWLDITHGLTTSRAVRWAWRVDPGREVARLALFATWLLFDTGRSERRLGVADRWRPALVSQEMGLDEARPSSAQPSVSGGDQVYRDLTSAIVHRRPERAIEFARGGRGGHGRQLVGETLAESALSDGAGSFLVAAHLIKTTQAAREEADVLASSLPLAAAARYLAAPRLERFVARTVAESVGFVQTGRPPRR